MIVDASLSGNPGQEIPAKKFSSNSVFNWFTKGDDICGLSVSPRDRDDIIQVGECSRNSDQVMKSVSTFLFINIMLHIHLTDLEF